jgi:hypothetical protein
VITLDINEMFNEWVETLLSPGTAFPKMVKNANLGAGIQHLVVGYSIYGILLFIAATLFGTMIGGALGMGFGASFGLMKAVMEIITGIIFGLIFAGIIWVFAKLLGGTGSYGAQLHMTSAPLAFVLVLQGILSFIPFLGPIIGALISLYYLYPLTLAIKEAHNLSTLKALAAWVLPIIIVFVLLAIFAAILGAALLGALWAANQY